MDLKWGKNGKRFRVMIEEPSKRKRVEQDVYMEESTQNHVKAQMLAKIDREITIYKQQIREYSFKGCCNNE
jgi:hypothetical protein